MRLSGYLAERLQAQMNSMMKLSLNIIWPFSGSEWFAAAKITNVELKITWTRLNGRLLKCGGGQMEKSTPTQRVLGDKTTEADGTQQKNPLIYVPLGLKDECKI